MVRTVYLNGNEILMATRAVRENPEKAGAKAQPNGLRERNKLEKLRNIKAAAWKLFTEKSFDEATTREIAQLAGVGMGTLFLYADNKRDLLFLISNDELARLSAIAASATAPDASAFDNLLSVFRAHYRYYGQHPQLSRSMLREMTFYDTGKQAREFNAIRTRLIESLTAIVREGQRRQELRDDASPQSISWAAFSLYQVELRSWLMADRPDLQSGLRRLRKSLRLLFEGVRAEEQTQV